MVKQIPIAREVYRNLEARAKEKGVTVQDYVSELIEGKTERNTA